MAGESGQAALTQPSLHLTASAQTAVDVGARAMQFWTLEARAKPEGNSVYAFSEAVAHDFDAMRTGHPRACRSPRLAPDGEREAGKGQASARHAYCRGPRLLPPRGRSRGPPSSGLQAAASRRRPHRRAPPLRCRALRRPHRAGPRNGQSMAPGRKPPLETALEVRNVIGRRWTAEIWRSN
jgi:hypothetical protein